MFYTFILFVMYFVALFSSFNCCLDEASLHACGICTCVNAEFLYYLEKLHCIVNNRHEIYGVAIFNTMNVENVCCSIFR